MGEFKEYIKTLDKEDLVDMICGTDDRPPIITRGEPKFSRQQFIWALIKVKNISLEEAEDLTDKLMNKIQGHVWNKIFNYDYLRFDIRKPSFAIFNVLFLFSLIGIATCGYLLYNFIF